MGSLASRPKVPKSSPQIVYVPAPVSGSDSGSEGVNLQPTPTPEQTTSQARINSLLSRDRSRLGTILTSFRGLLDLSQNSNKRKTLLGE